MLAKELGRQYVYWMSYKEDEAAEIQDWIEQLERSIVPCDKTIDALQQFLTDTLGMQQIPMSDAEVNRVKSVFIENHHKEWLQTPELTLPTDRMPTETEQQAWIAGLEQRHAEALAIPLEDTGLMFCKYRAEYPLECGDMAYIEVTLETSSYSLDVRRGHKGQETDREKAKAEEMIQQIILYKGVSAEDIRTKSQRFKEYVSTMISFQLRNGSKRNDWLKE